MLNNDKLKSIILMHLFAYSLQKRAIFARIYRNFRAKTNKVYTIFVQKLRKLCTFFERKTRTICAIFVQKKRTIFMRKTHSLHYFRAKNA